MRGQEMIHEGTGGPGHVWSCSELRVAQTVFAGEVENQRRPFFDGWTGLRRKKEVEDTGKDIIYLSGTSWGCCPKCVQSMHYF